MKVLKQNWTSRFLVTKIVRLLGLYAGKFASAESL